MKHNYLYEHQLWSSTKQPSMVEVLFKKASSKPTLSEDNPVLRRPNPFPKELISKRNIDLNRNVRRKKPSRLQRTTGVEDTKKVKTNHGPRRRRPRRNLTYSQWCRIVYAKHAKHYGLKWPNYKNRSRRIRKKKINRWVRVILGRALKLGRGHLRGSISLNYKNTRLLKHFISKHGKIMTRRQNRLSVMKQRHVKREIKTARAACVLPYHLTC